MIEVKNICVKYTKNKLALDNISFTMKPGTFNSLVGPSGCGKTTMLKILAGFLEPSEGEIIIDGKDITKSAIQDRGTAMVFQNYALWPHMTIFENVAYGLKLKKLPKEEIDKKVKNILDIVEIDYEISKLRKPGELSGGQQQRIALARALVVEPIILLMDEPLSNLDAKVRQRLRIEIRQIQQKLGVTAVYVTHDQEEAMSMSDQVIVMNNGVIAQTGSPKEVYTKPKNSFVAEFLGHSNVLKGKAQNKQLYILEEPIMKTDLNDSEVKIIIRSEDIHFEQISDKNIKLNAKIKDYMYSGNYYRYLVEVKGQELFVDSQIEIEDKNVILYIEEKSVYAFPL